MRRPAPPPQLPDELAPVAVLAGAWMFLFAGGTLGAWLNSAQGGFWVWWAIFGVLSGLVVTGTVFGTALLTNAHQLDQQEEEAAVIVDNWRPAFTEEEYAEIRKRVPMAGILNSGGPGYSDLSERVEELLYDAPPQPPRAPAGIVLATEAAALAVAQAHAAAAGGEVVRPRRVQPVRQQ